MNFNKQQPRTNYTVMVTKVSNGFILCLLNGEGEPVREAIASEYGLRDYSNYNFVTALESLYDYAEQLEKANQPLVAVPHAPDVTLAALLEEAVAEAREAEL